jgi:3-deoxy-D-manno-octulosonic acid (KDO) 8-phosphate synthase
LSDGPNMIRIDDLAPVLKDIKAIDAVTKKYKL